MFNATVPAIPGKALRRLEFLIGESTGVQILHPPGGKTVRYEAVCCGVREACDRFVQLTFFADIPGFGIETFTAMITYSAKKACYEMWVFSSNSEQPLHMSGDFKDKHLVMVSDPWAMPWGLQRLRSTFTPHDHEGMDYLTELWEPDGYVEFRRSRFDKRSVAV